MSDMFLLTALIIVVTPSAGFLYTLAAGLSRGVRGAIGSPVRPVAVAQE